MVKYFIYFFLIVFPSCLTASNLFERNSGNDFLFLNQSKIYVESNYGKSTEKFFKESSEELISENNQIEIQLEKEELSLTNKRKTLSRIDFRNLALSFDIKVEKIRLRQKNKSDKLLANLELNREKFYKLVSPLLTDFVSKNGILGIFDSSLMIIGNNKFDITDVIIDLINQNITELPITSLD